MRVSYYTVNLVYVLVLYSGLLSLSVLRTDIYGPYC